jgi:hypothetical protein
MVVLAFGPSAFSQGLIDFNNRTPGIPNPVNSPIYYGYIGFGAYPLSGTNQNFRAALLGGPTDAIPAHVALSRTNINDTGGYAQGTLSMLASPSTGATWVTFREGLFAGYVAVGTDGARDSGLPYGSIGQFQIVTWDGPYNSWAEAYAAWTRAPGEVFIGASNPMFLPTTQNAADLNLPTLQGLESFSIKSVLPEPNPMALFGLGLILWCIRDHTHLKIKP